MCNFLNFYVPSCFLIVFGAFLRIHSSLFNYALYIEYLNIKKMNCYRVSTIRLWLPQLFAIMEEYFIVNKSGNATICDMLTSHTEPKITFNKTLVVTDQPCVPVSYTANKVQRCVQWFMLLRSSRT
jgi:hypothetical protein